MWRATILLLISIVIFPKICIAKEFYTFWNKLNYEQKVIFLTGYQDGISALCGPLSKELTDRKIQKKYKMNPSDTDTWPSVDEYDKIKEDNYETCIIFWGFSERNEINKAIRALDYAYKKKSNDTPSYIIVMCSRLDEYKECIDIKINNQFKVPPDMLREK